MSALTLSVITTFQCSMVRFSAWLVNGYTHVFILLSIVIVTLPKQTSTNQNTKQYLQESK